jgi:hypothetical protein
MIVTLAIDDVRHLLTVLAEGAIDFEAIRAHLADERARRALGYRELIDARLATPAVTPAEVRRVVDLVRRESFATRLGPTAVVVSNDAAFGVLRMFGTLVDDVAAVRPFRDYREAVKWLAGARDGPNEELNS